MESDAICWSGLVIDGLIYSVLNNGVASDGFFK